jgi:16S rRNA processing protein RimM
VLCESRDETPLNLELRLLGYFSKVHGLKGELLIRAEAKVKKRGLKVLFVEVGGSKVPHFIKEIKEVEKGLIVSFEDVTNVNQASKLAGKKVFADSTLFLKEKNNQSLTGFEVIDEELGSLGPVESVDESGAQVLLALTFRGKELMLPFAKELVVKIDLKEKKLYYKAPPGLIEMYVGK